MCDGGVVCVMVELCACWWSCVRDGGVVCVLVELCAGVMELCV